MMEVWVMAVLLVAGTAASAGMGHFTNSQVSNESCECCN